MVNTTMDLDPEAWDLALVQAWEQGYELLIDSPSSVAGIWEFWELSPRPLDPAA